MWGMGQLLDPRSDLWSCWIFKGSFGCPISSIHVHLERGSIWLRKRNGAHHQWFNVHSNRKIKKTTQFTGLKVPGWRTLKAERMATASTGSGAILASPQFWIMTYRFWMKPTDLRSTGQPWTRLEVDTAMLCFANKKHENTNTNACKCWGYLILRFQPSQKITLTHCFKYCSRSISERRHGRPVRCLPYPQFNMGSSIMGESGIQ
jgi:hypothetical protein